MRVACILIACLLLDACSCSRKPDPDITIASTAQLPASAPGVEPADAATQTRRQILLEEQRRNMLEASSLVHGYLGALARGDIPGADVMWTGGKPAPVPDDNALRALGPVSMRIQSDPPRPLDPDELPSRSLEIPVHLHVSGSDGRVRNWEGWYRLRRKIGNDGWELSTASIQPRID